jgi:adenosine deaminase
VEDPALVAELAERGIVLEVCPTSNVATRVYPSYEDHPLGALRDAGVRITLASDDPPYFGASIGGEYAVARERFGFSEAELMEITRVALDASFASAAVKASLLGRLGGSADGPTL